MKRTISGIIALIVLIFVCTSGLIEPIVNFFVWLVTLNMTQSNVSIAGEIFVKVASFLISYTLVGFIFNSLLLFNSNIMKVVYFIISTIVSFALCYLVMIFETHLLIISIIAIVLLVLLATIYIIDMIKDKKKI